MNSTHISIQMPPEHRWLWLAVHNVQSQIQRSPVSLATISLTVLNVVGMTKMTNEYKLYQMINHTETGSKIWLCPFRFDKFLDGLLYPSRHRIGDNTYKAKVIGHLVKGQRSKGGKPSIKMNQWPNGKALMGMAQAGPYVFRIDGLWFPVPTHVTFASYLEVDKAKGADIHRHGKKILSHRTRTSLDQFDARTLDLFDNLTHVWLIWERLFKPTGNAVTPILRVMGVGYVPGVFSKEGNILNSAHSNMYIPASRMISWMYFSSCAYASTESIWESFSSIGRNRSSSSHSSASAMCSWFGAKSWVPLHLSQIPPTQCPNQSKPQYHSH